MEDNNLNIDNKATKSVNFIDKIINDSLQKKMKKK